MREERDPDDPRYDELLRALQLGAPPPWVPAAARPRLALLADGHRLALASAVALGFPRASYYATAVYGAAFLDGVAQVLVDLPPGPASIQDKARLAAERWSQTTGRADLAELFVHDRLQSDSPETAGRAAFEHDIEGFVLLLDRFKERSAPVEIVRTYAPARLAPAAAPAAHA